MTHPHHGKGLTLGMAAAYRIKVQGCLCESWSDRLSGLSIISNHPADQAPVTILEGRLRDQAELIGVLNSLYELRLPLLFVEFVKTE